MGVLGGGGWGGSRELKCKTKRPYWHKSLNFRGQQFCPWVKIGGGGGGGGQLPLFAPTPLGSATE